MTTVKMKAFKVHFCLICCKCKRSAGEGDCSVNEGAGTQVLNRFVTLLGRHVGKVDWREEGDSLDRAGVCDPCGELLKAFCELDEQLNRIRLEMDWKVKSVVDKMERAGRVPARMREIGKALDNELASGDDGGRRGRIMEAMQMKRARILENCKKKLKRSEPRVVIADTTSFTVESRQTLSSLKIGETKTSESESPKSLHEATHAVHKIDCDSDTHFMITAEGYDEDASDYSHEEKYSPGDLEVEVTPDIDLPRKTDNSLASPRSSRRTRVSRTYKEDSDPDFDPDEAEEKETRAPPEDTRGAFICPFCSMPYSKKYKSNVIRHLRERHSMSLEEAKRTFQAEIDVTSDPPPKDAEGEGKDSGSITKFQCSQCPALYTFKSSILKHLRAIHSMSLDAAKETFKSLQTVTVTPQEMVRQHAPKRHPCQYCSLKFSFRCNLRKHMKRDHPTESSKIDNTPKITPSYKYPCPHCDKGGTTASNLVRHIKVWHSNSHKPKPSRQGRKYIKKWSKYKPSIPCQVPDCSESFLREEDLEVHAQLHGTFPCAFCPAVKTYAPDLSRHEMEDHVSPNSTGSIYKCPRCDLTFPNLSKLTTHHVETHLNLSMKVLSCDICQARFCKKESLQKHQNSSHPAIDNVEPTEVQRCDQCPAYFLQTFQLTLHKRHVHSVNSSPTCHLCGRQFTLKVNLKFHLKTVHKLDDERSDLPVACDVTSCKKRFGTTEEMEWHKRWYQHDKQWVNCPQCGRACEGPHRLKSHLKTHREWICEKCGVGFKKKAELTQHYIFHKSKAEWEFTCEICGNKFATVYRLRDHVKRHEGVKPWKCGVCGKAFVERNRMRAHMRRIHKAEEMEEESGRRKRKKSRFISRREAD